MARRRGVESYRHYPRDYIQHVQGLGPDVIGAYTILLDLMYVHGGSAPRDHRHLAQILGCSTRRAGRLIDRLLEAGKIEQRGERLTVDGVEAEVEHGRQLQEQRSQAGQIGGPIGGRARHGLPPR